MSRGALAALVLAACASRGADRPPAAPAAVSAQGAPRAPVPLAPAALLAAGADEANVLLRLSVARAHPLGPRLDPFVLAWPGWGATIRRISEHPVAELDWIDVVGPRDPASERLAARTRVDDATIDARLASHGDGTLRRVVREQPNLVTAVPPASADALLAALRTSRVADPEAEDELGLRADAPHPHAFFAVIPDEAKRGVLRVFARGAGGAEARLELACDGPEAAAKVAGELRAEAERVNGVAVKLLTLDLLGGLTVEAAGPDVHVRLPATREQLEALATLASGMLPADAPLYFEGTGAHDRPPHKETHHGRQAHPP